MNSKLIATAVLLLAASTAAQTKFRTPERIPDKIMSTALQTIDGSAAIKLSNEKRIIVLGMWAAWCGPCRYQLPELEKINTKYRDRGLQVVGLVSLEEHANAEEVRLYVSQLKLTFYSLWITRHMSERLDPNHLLPITFVITNDGTVIRTFLGWNNKKTPRLLRKAVKEALGGEPKPRSQS